MVVVSRVGDAVEVMEERWLRCCLLLGRANGGVVVVVWGRNVLGWEGEEREEKFADAKAVTVNRRLVLRFAASATHARKAILAVLLLVSRRCIPQK